MQKNFKRLGFTPAQKHELWERWRRGEQMKLIGRAIGKRSSSISSHIRSTGGYTPVERKRSRLALSLAEREEISRGLVAGHSFRFIAELLRRSSSAISREVSAMAANDTIVPPRPISVPGSELCAQRHASWFSTVDCGKLLFSS